MILGFGGTVHIRAPERGESWVADLSLIPNDKVSAAVYLTASECRHLARWLDTMADAAAVSASAVPQPDETTT